MTLFHHTGGGIVIDLGTGDGRFVSAAAKANPDKFFIGIDPNVKPLEKLSTKATRKPAKGGLPNALFVQAAIEDLPEELDGVADELHIHFPWGSLLRAVTTGDEKSISSLRRLCSLDCLIEIVIGIDPERDRSEIGRLGIPSLTDQYLTGTLFPNYAATGMELVAFGHLATGDWSRIDTSWARRLSGGKNRDVTFLSFRAV